MDSGFYCAHCNSLIDDLPNGKAVRSDTCPNCIADLHSCVNCKFYDQAAYNECREPQAERVVDKEKANFCDYFSVQFGKRDVKDRKENALKKLDDLFK